MDLSQQPNIIFNIMNMMYNSDIAHFLGYGLSYIISTKD
jgi:hypothetical protein